MEPNEMLQQYLAQAVKMQREERMRSSIQLTLGELIAQIEAAGVYDEDGKPKDVQYDFGYIYPTVLDSWRGSYAELALGYSENYPNENRVNAEQLLKDCKEAIGKTFEGYKGGDYVMDANTPVWVANYGDSSETGIVGILDKGYKLVILTSYMEY